ncbi:MAG: DUF262 domain-containing HNH endonuclease family protein [Nitrospira sp.]|nr:DUF262 domain-containing HNH endonuclease family protein [Nitrospira sp.]
MTVISSKPMTFSKLFYEGLFSVPWHQRKYDWKREHVQDLLHDINEAVKGKRPCYFLGSIMLVEKGDKHWEINDGQQRMITFSLVCARLCRLFSQQNPAPLPTVHETMALRIIFDLDENSTATLSESDNFKPRITPPRDDLSRYHLMIRGKNIGANGKLTIAWQEIDSFISAMGQQQADAFFRFLTQKIEVACLYIPDSVDPNDVFETINCRGKQLDDLDLIRNYLYSYFNGDEECTRRDTVHNNLEAALTRLRDTARAADYVRCYFQCKYGFLPKARFYREARKCIGSKADGMAKLKKPRADYVYGLVNEFTCCEWVELFRKISDPNKAGDFVEQFIKASQSANSKRTLSSFLRELQSYTVVQPLVFALLVHYVREPNRTTKRRVAKDVHICMKNITSFVMRTAFAAPKFEPSHFESEFSNLAEEILSSDSLDMCKERIIERLKECDYLGIIDNRKFVERLTITNVEMRDPKKAKRFLVGLNAYMQTDSTVINEKACTVEHVLPQSEEHRSGCGWSDFQGQKHEEWIHRIGNLTLLGTSDNKPDKKSNESFREKKPLLARSALALTKKIADYKEWSGDTIIERQKEMAECAARVWAFPR